MTISDKSIETKYRGVFSDFVKTLYISSELKALLISDETSTGSYIYLIYPQLFIQAFAINDREKVNQLCLAGYLTFRNLTYIDQLVDNQIENSKKGLYYQLAMICQEEAIKILTSLFPIHSVFWKFWNQRKTEYLVAQKMEKKTYAHLNLEDFLDIADYKSSFGKVAIDSLLLLQGKVEHTKETNTLLESHRNFSIGRQFYDDINDIREDLKSKQSNYAFKKLQINLEKEGIDISLIDESQLENYLYVSGTAQEILKESILYFEIAIELSLTVISENSLWVKAIKTFSNGCEKMLQIQNQYLKEIEEQVA